jgi:hypothetical protein
MLRRAHAFQVLCAIICASPICSCNAIRLRKVLASVKPTFSMLTKVKDTHKHNVMVDTHKHNVMVDAHKHNLMVDALISLRPMAMYALSTRCKYAHNEPFFRRSKSSRDVGKRVAKSHSIHMPYVKNLVAEENCVVRVYVSSSNDRYVLSLYV